MPGNEGALPSSLPSAHPRTNSGAIHDSTTHLPFPKATHWTVLCFGNPTLSSEEKCCLGSLKDAPVSALVPQARLWTGSTPASAQNPTAATVASMY